jgi:YebC/PmpR family DNA-binding regulatory protein
MIECVTDNRNRTVAELRHLIAKHNGNLGESGSVGWMFERKGVVTIAKENHTEDELMEVILEADADDLRTEDEFFEVISSIENFEKVRKAIEDKKYKIENASVQQIAKNLVELDEKGAADVVKFLEVVEEHDDVQNIFSNADF